VRVAVILGFGLVPALGAAILTSASLELPSGGTRFLAVVGSGLIAFLTSVAALHSIIDHDR
jgi:hypothetical protein